MAYEAHQSHVASHVQSKGTGEQKAVNARQQGVSDRRSSEEPVGLRFPRANAVSDERAGDDQRDGGERE